MANDLLQSLQSRQLAKYHRTPHLQGSRYQPGDKGTPVRYNELAGRFVVIEEKLDGSNTGLSFDAGATLLVQSRGHYLDIDRAGGRERQFNMLKRWGRAQEGRLLGVLEDRFIMYGEYMYAKHSLFFDALPHLFCEFDIWDRSTETFLGTVERHALLADVPVVSVPVLYAGVAPRRIDEILDLVGPSVARTAHWRASFEDAVARERLDLAQCWQQTDKSDFAEGLYIKVEEDGRTIGRYKFVRPDFTQTILDSGSHDSERPIIRNRLRVGVDLMAAEVDKAWPCGGQGRLK